MPPAGRTAAEPGRDRRPGGTPVNRIGTDGAPLQTGSTYSRGGGAGGGGRASNLHGLAGRGSPAPRRLPADLRRIATGRAGGMAAGVAGTYALAPGGVGTELRKRMRDDPPKQAVNISMWRGTEVTNAMRTSHIAKRAKRLIKDKFSKTTAQWPSGAYPYFVSDMYAAAAVYVQKATTSDMIYCLEAARTANGDVYPAAPPGAPPAMATSTGWRESGEAARAAAVVAGGGESNPVDHNGPSGELSDPGAVTVPESPDRCSTGVGTVPWPMPCNCWMCDGGVGGSPLDLLDSNGLPVGGFGSIGTFSFTGSTAGLAIPQTPSPSKKTAGGAGGSGSGLDDTNPPCDELASFDTPSSTGFAEHVCDHA